MDRRKSGRVNKILFVLILLLSCTGCMQESYKEFIVEKLHDGSVEDYFLDETVDFARIEDIIFVPEIKEVKHGEYWIYISVYCQNESRQVNIQHVCMKDGEKTVLAKESNERLTLEKTEDGFFEAWVVAGIFTDEAVNVKDGQKLSLMVTVCVGEGADVITETITYEIGIKGYQAFVTPV